MKTRSERHGKSTLAVEVTNVSPNGIWLFFGAERQERFLSFEAFPWFANATIAEIADVSRPSRHHLYWPALDVDVAVDSIDSPEKFPLVSRKKRAPFRKAARHGTTRKSAARRRA
jgi:hypothetical protein